MWELRIYDLDGGTQLASYTPSSPGGIVGPFRWASYPTGGTIRLQFGAIPNKVDIPPLSYAVLSWDSTPVASGVVITSWPAWDGRVRVYEVASTRYLFTMRVIGPAELSGTVSDILLSILGKRHPAVELAPMLTYDATTKLTIDGVSTLSDVLDRIVPLTGRAWDVLPGWPPMFALIPTDVTSILPYEAGSIQVEPINMTGVPHRLAVLYRTATDVGEEKEGGPDPGYAPPFPPTTYPSSPYYGPLYIQLASGELTSSLMLQQPPVRPLAPLGASGPNTSCNNQNQYPTYAIDGNYVTYYCMNARGPRLVITYPILPWTVTVWFRTTYPQGTTAETVRVYLRAVNSDATERGSIVHITGPVGTSLVSRTVNMARYPWGPEAITQPTNIQFAVDDVGAFIGIFEVVATQVNSDAVLTVVQSIYAPLHQIAGAQLVYPRYIAPASIVSVQDGPYGPISGPVETVDYELSAEGGLITRMRLGRTMELTRELIDRATRSLQAQNRIIGGVT